MGNRSIVDKAAEKSFFSSAIQKSWKVHIKAFGPILEPAFPKDYRARIELVAALNYISRRDYKKGMQKLESLTEFCVTDADKAMCFFSMGLIYDMSGQKDGMLFYYQEAGAYHHDFYLPYLKIARSAHMDAAFEAAELYYREAVRCLDMQELNDESRAVLGGIYSNLASCLTMMHRYEDAQTALKRSYAYSDSVPNRIATDAILHAALGEADYVEELLNNACDIPPQYIKAIRDMTNSILSGKNPNFYETEIDLQSVDEFWNWFSENQNALIVKAGRKEYEDVFQMLQPRLKQVFSFLERMPEFAIEPEEDHFRIYLADFYAVALRKGYEILIDTCPLELRRKWVFEIVH